MTDATYDAIMVLTDKMTKYAYFVPYRKDSTVQQLEYWFKKTIVANHGAPNAVISDRDTKLTSLFWTSLMKQMGIQRKMSTAFHAQTNGQTERTNQTLEEYLRHYVTFKQDDWVSHLPMAQFAFNSSIHEATGLTPYFANYGWEPTAYYEPKADDRPAAAAQLSVQELRELQQQLTLDLKFVAYRMAHYYNNHRSTEPILKEGDKVFLIRRNIKTKRPSLKLDHVKLGPFQVEKALGRVTYKLKLPRGRKIHPVFHISMLEPAPQQIPLSDKWEICGAEEEYEIEEIRDEERRGRMTFYLVKWKGYPEEENTWEPATNFPNAKREIQRFQKTRRQAQVNLVGKTRYARGIPVTARNLERRLEDIGQTIRDPNAIMDKTQYKELQKQWEKYVELRNEFEYKTRSKDGLPSYHETQMEDIVRSVRQINMVQGQQLEYTIPLQEGIVEAFRRQLQDESLTEERSARINFELGRAQKILEDLRDKEVLKILHRQKERLRKDLWDSDQDGRKEIAKNLSSTEHAMRTFEEKKKTTEEIIRNLKSTEHAIKVFEERGRPTVEPETKQVGMVQKDHDRYPPWALTQQEEVIGTLEAQLEDFELNDEEDNQEELRVILIALGTARAKLRRIKTQQQEPLRGSSARNPSLPGNRQKEKENRRDTAAGSDHHQAREPWWPQTPCPGSQQTPPDRQEPSGSDGESERDPDPRLPTPARDGDAFGEERPSLSCASDEHLRAFHETGEVRPRPSPPPHAACLQGNQLHPGSPEASRELSLASREADPLEMALALAGDTEPGTPEWEQIARKNQELLTNLEGLSSSVQQLASNLEQWH